MASKCGDEAFTPRGLGNWKDAKGAFTKYKQTKCHKEVIYAVVAVPSVIKIVQRCSHLSMQKKRLKIDKCCIRFYQVFDSWRTRLRLCAEVVVERIAISFNSN